LQGAAEITYITDYVPCTVTMSAVWVNVYIPADGDIPEDTVRYFYDLAIGICDHTESSY
jgi:hypothetical protein